jgi:CRP/FNR family transcriptional regulator
MFYLTQPTEKEANMKSFNNIKAQHQCLECEMRSDQYFCNLPDVTLKIFESLKITNAYPQGSTLFIEGQPSNGIYMLCKGRVKLSTSSPDGKIIILRIAEAGEVLGLSATVSNSNYETTAEVIESCQVNFVRKDDFLNFLQHHAEACLSAVKQLSNSYNTAFVQICSLALSNSVADKLAKLFLGWCKPNHENNGSVHLKISYTHEEMAEMIGTSRETVSRLLKEFKERKLITLKGSDLVIPDKKKLEASIGNYLKGR